MQKAIEEVTGQRGKFDSSKISMTKIIKMAEDFNRTNDMSIWQTTKKMCRLLTLADTYNKFCKNLTCRMLYVPKTVGSQQEVVRCFSMFDTGIWPMLRRKQANLLRTRRGGTNRSVGPIPHLPVQWCAEQCHGYFMTCHYIVEQCARRDRDIIGNYPY